MKFLSIGECMLELAPQDHGLYSAGFAGDTFNTAWYVAQLGKSNIKPMYFTAVGNDLPSQNMVAFMRDAGVEPIVKIRADKSVGLYMISLKDGERSFSYWRSDSAAKTLADDLVELPVTKGDIVFFSGITLAILSDQGRSNLLSVLRKCKSNGVRVVFDPNLRPKLWASEDEMLHWTMKGAGVADICLPSYEDEATYFGDRNPTETCQRYAKAGVTIVVTKNGPDPILISDSGTYTQVVFDPLDQVVDTTAAGDSFNAMFLSSYLSGQSLADAAFSASQLSAKVISQRGALVDIS